MCLKEFRISASPEAARGSTAHGRGRGVGPGSHHLGGGATDSPYRAGKAGLRTTRTSNSSASRSTHTGATGARDRNTGHSLVLGRRALHSHRYDILASKQNKAENSLFLSLRGLGRLGLQLPKLLAVTQDDVHVLVESFELSDEGPGVLKNNPHPAVDVALHFITLTHFGATEMSLFRSETSK